MNLSKSIDFLLENAGPVIRYRLRKNILKDLSKIEEEALLEQIYHTPYFKLVQSYVKPDGYIGVGIHGWNNWRGVKLHETPLQDGEVAARLLAYYAIPKTHPIVANFVAALRDEDILREEFTYIPPAIQQFERRFEGLNNGNSLMSIIYALQAMLGYGDNYPYIEADEYFPDTYTLTMLAYTQSWRTDDNIQMLADSINHIDKIMKPDNCMYIRIDGRYYAPCFSFIKPFRPFSPNLIDSIVYHRPLTEIAMLGVGDKVQVLKKSVENIEQTLDENGILNMNFNVPHNKRYSPKKIEYPTAYEDVRLEPDYKNKTALLCELTYWAVELVHLYERKALS